VNINNLFWKIFIFYGYFFSLVINKCIIILAYNVIILNLLLF